MKRRLACSLFVCLLAASVHASVTQVDGTIVPHIGASACTDVDTELQPCVDAEEGGTPGTLNVVRDADTVPEIFLPDLASVVTFRDISESAGFENSFGYYNVGDDVSTPTGRMQNLRPIMGCGVPASSHPNAANGYVRNAEHIIPSNPPPGTATSTTVNFMTEMTAGRYKGGYIAFYLITPQGHPNGSADNCGDFEGPAGTFFFGHAYFTQHDLNNDGDFVHHLVYTSKAKAKQFYFGFEDLFRGGDNDFDDMAMMVNGLTPPCLPTAELCNNRDDNCNGTIDDNPVDVGQSCTAGVGACLRTGAVVCAAGGVPTCNAVPGPTMPELCNNIDDDCNGLVDDDPTDVGQPCTVGVGACQRTGVFLCVGGIRKCSVVPGDPEQEICDGLDNDCDGMVDEDFPIGQPCDGVGQCGPGVLECAGPLTTRCSTDPGGSQDQSQPEVCNGLDDNCNGVIDEGLNDMGPCGVSNVGACQFGVLTCRMGAPVCVGAINPSPEVCDGLDNDCNGTPDDMPVGVGQPCGSDVGECRPGTETCVGGSLVCQGGTPPSDEKCDGLDNDCDGLIDNDPVDVGTPCGPVRPGECKQGKIVCIQGAPQCRGQIDPTPEICDGLDNNCDGEIDNEVPGVGTPCNVRPGVCTPGTLTCMGKLGLICAGGTGGTPEVCNGLDDDCNGIIDDNVPGVGEPCGSDVGNCQLGKIFCINGGLECVGGRPPTTEVCDGIDNNCNGMVDEGTDICGGGLCISGQCASPCTPGEFSCPPGKRCQNNYCLPDPCFDVQCPKGADGTLNICVEGACVTKCSTVTCTSPAVCRKTDGACAPNNCSFLPYLCAANQLCKDAVCIDDPCFGKTCPTDQFCRDGTCHASCANVVCGADEECQDGTCVKTGCGECRTGYVCSDTQKLCVPNMCTSPFQCSSQPGTVCDPATGACVTDPCIGVNCPGGEKCSFGQCINPSLRVPVYATGGSGCNVGGDGGGLGALALVLAALVALRWRRYAPLALLVCMSCKIDPYYLELEGDGGIPGGTADARLTSDGSIIGGGDGGGPTCIPGTVEVCDGVDNNCDGRIDEGFDLDADPFNCGGCGIVCAKPGAQYMCDRGQCKFVQCFPGFYDLDHLPGNGCEYPCFPSNGGVEVCDTLDNNCDGRVDENVDKMTDLNNCGQCGKQCKFFKVVNARCTAGVCSFNPATDCEPGFHDADHKQETGCEYECTPTNGGVEICDYLDNDCDGIVDNGFDNNTPESCGTCGHQCVFPNVPSPKCTAGQCTFNPATDCAPGFHDANGNPLDGCEYFCMPTNGGKEICDGLDNDCDGEVDESSDVVANDGRVGQTCGSSNVGECKLGQTVCSLGQIKCVGAVGPKSETCNGKDDDCDGTVDNPEKLTDVGFVCAPSKGLCSFGLTACSGGMLSCVREIGPAPEVCDGLDNDCNGIADDGVLPGVGLACGGGTVNGPPSICSQGTTACMAGNIQCVGGVGPTTEACDGMDNNCNGTVDEAAGGGTLTQVCYSGPSGTAGLGPCKAGSRTCTNGTFSGPCVGEVVPTAESCNGLDDDCDGVADDAPGGGLITQSCYDGPAGTSGVGPCHGGTQTCIGGAFGACVGEVLPRPEICFNGVNDNCDASGGDQGCFATAGDEFRVDGIPGAGLSSAAGADHSFDADIAASGTNVYVVFADNRQSAAKPQIFLARSTDNGVTFATPLVPVTNDTTNAYTSPRVKVVGTTVVVAYTRVSAQQSPRDMLLRVSTNGGASFGTEKVLDTGASSDSFHFDVDAVQSGAAVKCAVVWEELDTASASLNRDIRVARSSSCGMLNPTFDTVQTANKGTSHIAGRPRVAFANSDRIVVVWREQRSNMTFDIFVNLWDGAAINTTDTRIDTDPVPGQDDFPMIARNGGEVYITWQELKPSNANSDIVFVRSTDNGSTFGAEINIDDMGMLASYGSASPQIAAVTVGTDRRVYITWQDTRQGTEIFAARSTNGGMTFEPVKRVSSVSNPTPGVSRENRLAADASNRVAVVYTTTRNGLRDIYLGYSIDGGVFWQTTDIRLDQGTAGSGTSVSPVVGLLANGTPVSAWVDFRTNGIDGDIYFRRAPPQ